MPEFTYLVLDAAGSEQRGSLRAADERAAARDLCAAGLAVLALRPKLEPGARPSGVALLRRGMLGRRRPSARAREAFLRQLSVLLRSGLTLIQALETVRSGSAPEPVRRSAERLAHELRAGRSFSEALAPFGDLVGASALERIATAELTGELDRALEAVASDLERARRVRAQLRTALAYPALVLVIALGVAGLLVLKVVPRFALFFAASGKPLPPLMAHLVNASELVAALAPPLGLLLVITVATILLLRRRAAGRLWLDRVLLETPGLGWLVSRHALWRATHALGQLIQAGIPILASLRLAGAGSGNAVLTRAFERAAERVLAGEEIARALEQPHVPIELRQVVAVGERSGELASVLSHLAADYERQVESAVAGLSAATEPALLVIVGGLVGSIYIAFFQAIFQVAGG